MFNTLSETLENFFGNSSFAFLFFAMVFYWIDTAFFEHTSLFGISQTLEPKNDTVSGNNPFSRFFKLENIATYAMILANLSVVSLLVLRWQNSGHFPLSNLYESLMFLCWSCTGIYLLILKSTYQGTPFLGSSPAYTALAASSQEDNKERKDINKKDSSGVVVLPLFFRGLKDIKKKKVSLETSESKKLSLLQGDVFFYKLLGSIVSPCALFINAYATFSLPKEMQNAAPLVPALQSNWLMMHVTVMIISYSALMLGSLLAIAFLIITSNSQSLHANHTSAGYPNGTNNEKYFLQTNLISVSFDSDATHFPGRDGEVTPTSPLPSLVPSEYSLGTSESNPLLRNPLLRNPFPEGEGEGVASLGEGKGAMQILAKNLDNLSYRILGIGFPFLTIGILSGAVWANEAWGSYWSWDPKETWALVTWLVFALYLHMRLSHGWQGRKPAIMASVGFLTVWFCFLGVNLLGAGLHSYGFVS